MTREELIEMGRDAMGRNDGWRWWAPRHLNRLLDVWEPAIRADEMESIAARGTSAALKTMRREVEAEVRERLRAQVMNLPDAHRTRERSGAHYGRWHGDGSIWLADVLALLDGGAR